MQLTCCKQERIKSYKLVKCNKIKLKCKSYLSSIKARVFKASNLIFEREELLCYRVTCISMY